MLDGGHWWQDAPALSLGNVGLGHWWQEAPALSVGNVGLAVVNPRMGNTSKKGPLFTTIG